MALPLMVDLSSNNAPPDLAAHYKAGYRTIALKASENTGYRWPAHDTLADTWHSLGGRVVHYHFAQAGDPVGQARWFISVVRPHYRSGDVLVLDCERGGVNQPFVTAFIDTVTALLHSDGMIYGSPAFLNANGIRKYKGWRLWLAEYGPNADVPRSWLTWMAWQWTDKATGIPGIPGAVDCSHIKGWLLPFVRPAITYPRLSFGATGAWVHKLQALLNSHGFKLVIDGTFGPATKTALNQFKKAHHLPVNGVCGAGAWWVLTH